MNAAGCSFVKLYKKIHGDILYKFIFTYGIPWFINVLGEAFNKMLTSISSYELNIITLK